MQLVAALWDQPRLIWASGCSVRGTSTSLFCGMLTLSAQTGTTPTIMLYSWDTCDSSGPFQGALKGSKRVAIEVPSREGYYMGISRN